ncbi:PREDICTED: solute carrier family 7 member 13-like [Galeopterus variegatus]|uniref:Solute carrier family 7 member 13-like n=1 Tax=Galeopterus variegatus TaxID=482537 RepID=A0ABM0S3S2_GALVR|nr:PREDICTED: solute carrier family 7 member 13-like [Galeopterus variegatus]
MQLSREIGFFHGNIFLLSIMIGSGIFVSLKGVLKYSSLNIPVSLSIWAACALLNMITALCHAELGTTFPRSGAPYYFLKRSLGSSVAFLSLWIKLFAFSLGIGALNLLISSYIIRPFYAGCPAPELPKKCLALTMLWSLGILNAQGMVTVAWFQTISTLVKMAVLCFISITGIAPLVTGKKENLARFENALDAEFPNASQVAEALLQGFFAYSGSSILINLAGRDKNPAKNIPKSLITTISGVTVIYLLVNISYLAVLTPKEIISSEPKEKHEQARQESKEEILCLAVPPFRVPLPFVFGTIAMSLFLIFVPMIQFPKTEHIYQFIFILGGLFCYWIYVHLNQHSVCFDKITCYLQLLFNFSPPEDHDDCFSTGKE